MTLTALLKEFPNISIANESENLEILDYYHRTQISTESQDIIYKRGDDFFAFLKEKSRDYLVFLLRTNEGEINGLACLSFRDGFIDGEMTKVGYLGDLRVSLNRKLIRQWRKFYGDLIQYSPEMQETFYCQNYQTALIDDNSQSKANLLNSKIPNITYKLIENYNMVNIVGSYLKIKKQPSVMYLDTSLEEQAIELLQKDHKLRQFGHDFPSQDEYRKKNWEEFKNKNYVVAKDNGIIKAVACAWSPKGSKQLIINNVPWAFKMAKKLSRLIPYLNIFNLPKRGKPIHILYLFQLSFHEDLQEFERHKVFKQIVDFYYLENPNLNLLAFCDFDQENYKQDLKGYIVHNTPMGLYSVNKEIKSTNKMPIFDMALV